MSEAVAATFVEWMRAIYERPGTSPPPPESVSLDKCIANGWLVRCGDGWAITDSARSALSFPRLPKSISVTSDGNT